MRTNFFRSLGAFSIVGILTPLVCAGVALGTLLFLPLPATLPEANPGVESRASHVLDIDGNEIALFREFEQSIQVAPTDIPQVLKDAVIASEDRNFYSHGGVDIRATGRALWADIRNRGVVQGGSTITQQYVKNAFTGGERTITRKIREAILAAELDRQMDKEEILYKYLSTIYLGEGAFGVGAASETYFRKPVSQLTLSEAALLAGVIPAPSRYSPRDNPQLAEQKRIVVLNTMLDQEKITPEQHAAALAEVLYTGIAAAPPPGPATVVWPPQQQVSIEPWFTDYVRRWLTTHLPGCTPDDCPQILRGGLTIETTLDPVAQLAAKEEVARSVDGTDPTIQMALVSVEPPTGFVRAMVGGRDFALSQVNTALGSAGGGQDKQVGSAFKPFVLATAFDQGIPPTKVYAGSPHDVSRECGGTEPLQNYGGSSYGSLDLRRATEQSVNTVYTRLILDVGVEQTMATARNLGVTLPPFDGSIYCASVALGAEGASPLEMASAFGVFATRGRLAEPTPVIRVLDSEGKVIIDNTRAVDNAKQAISAVVADNVTDVLKGVLTNGTAAGRGLDRPAAGKTGTTQDNSNAWFIGYTPTLSTAVWIGHLEGDTPLRNVKGVRAVTGGTIPAATWQRYMNRALRNVPATEFNEPAPIRAISDQQRRKARGGFDPGDKKSPARAPGGVQVVQELGEPTAEAPTTTTTFPGRPPPTFFPPPPQSPGVTIIGPRPDD